MLNESLIKDDESFSGLYFSFVIIFILAFSVLFSLVTASMPATSDLYALLSFAVSPVAIICATLFFVYLKGESVIKVCGFAKTDVKYYVIALVAFVSVFFGLGHVNTAFVDFLSEKLGYDAAPITLPEFSAINYLSIVLTVCILPALAEEIAMRGIVLRGIKSGSVILNAVIGGLLFSLFHMSPMQTPYQFAVGFIFSLIAIRSGSTVPTVIAHFLNNFAIVTIEYFCPTLFAVQGGWMLAIIIPAIICAVAVTAFLIIGKDNGKAEKGNLKGFFLCALAGIVICVLMWISSFLG